jgi:hypothetical protein
MHVFTVLHFAKNGKTKQQAQEQPEQEQVMQNLHAFLYDITDALPSSNLR